MKKTSRKTLRHGLDIILDGENPRRFKKADQDAVKAAHQHQKKWSLHPNIVGFGIGEKIQGGAPKKRLSLKVYVTKKTDITESNGGVPEKIVLPLIDDEIETDIEVLEEFELAGTISSGSYIENPGHGSRGSLGAVVNRRHNGTTVPVVLSNAHVLGYAEKGARIGDPISGTPYRQTGEEFLGTLLDMGDLKFSPTHFYNLYDAAIASVTSENLSTLVPQTGRKVEKFGKKPSQYNRVWFEGARSGLQKGVVRDPDFRCSFKYPRNGGAPSRVGFSGQIMSSAEAKKGDSGAGLFSRKGELIGVVFARFKGGSVASPIAPIKRRFHLAPLA